MKPNTLSFLVAVALAGNSWAASPYDVPYGVQWSFIIGDPAANDFPNTVTASPDGTVWIAARQAQEVWGNPNTAYTASGQTGYGQITPNGLILQGNDIGDCVPGLVGYADGSNPNIRFAPGDGTGKAYFNANIDVPANWSDASPPDAFGQFRASFSISSLAGTTPVNFNGTDNSTLPIVNAAGLDPTDKFTFDFLTSAYPGANQDTAMGSDGSYIIATQNQVGDMFTAGDFSGPSGTSYKPAIGRVGNDGVTLSGPANHPSCGGRSFFSDVYLNENAGPNGRVYAAGSGSTSSGGTMNFFDPDGPGPIASIPLNSATADTNKGFAVVYDASTWAVLQAVVWETAQGGDVIADIIATPDGGFVICGNTKGTMKVGGLNPTLGTNDGYIQKYNAAGVLVWDYQTQTTVADTFVDMSLDEDGNIYVSGTDTNATTDATLRKFKSLDGTLVWKSVISSSGSETAVDSNSLNKTKVYVLIDHNTSGGTWANTISYVPAGRESLLQKMSPGDFNANGNVDFTDVQLAGTATMPGLTGVDTYDFNDDGDSTLADTYYMITNVMDRLVGDTAQDLLVNDVDNADIGKAIGSVAGSGKLYLDGDIDFDTDVDATDITAVAGAFTGAKTGGQWTNGTPGATLRYRASDGQVWLHASEATGAKITSFQLENAAGTFVPANYTSPAGGSFGGSLEDDTSKVLGDTDLTLAGASGTVSLGTVFPTGMDLAGLTAYLKTSVYTGQAGTGQMLFTLVVGDLPAGYGTWSGGPAADIDTNGDGVQNGVAWALGAADPNANAIGLLPALDNTTDPTYLLFTFNRSDEANDDPNTAITVEYGNDLVGWTTAVDDNDNVEIEVTPGTPTDAVVVKLKRSTLGATGKIFARLKVVVTP
jgi:hypothetical protein